MKVAEIARVLELLAPTQYAEEWDNVGLLVGDSYANVRKVMFCIDLTEEVLAEAVQARAQMVMAYHPVIFKPAARMTPQDQPVVFQAVKKGISVYSMHTALDVAPGGTNDVLAEAIGLDDTKPLTSVRQTGRNKIVVFCNPEEVSEVARAAFAAGAGVIGDYHDCAFFSHGIGAFTAGDGCHPTIGRVGEHEVVEEVRLELVAPENRSAEVCQAIRNAHSYEEPAIDVYPLQEYPPGFGMGRIGRFDKPLPASTLINRIKKATGLKKVLVAACPQSGKQTRGDSGTGGLISVAACCAGSCGSMWKTAARNGANFYLTGEMRHHDALAAARNGLTVVCLGHSNSERMTLAKVAKRLKNALPKVQTVLSKRDRDPFDIV